MKLDNNKLQEFVGSEPLPECAPPMAKISRPDLVLAAFVICHRRKMLVQETIDTLFGLGASPEECRTALGRVVQYYAEKN